ncbi:type II toxin-antitoxin system RelE family toxin [Dactylococcopsis salina]|uniref:Addiction module toxin, RelE/StbE family n=1 Tax=Dactylococcopsis salina (strain PCC 8305) TaxID=13035 RepID=K9YYG5_DACS8|nr:type II toxin-antitoxin system RelE/ParE family toxin [Dactylococcopsis salina]AFZ51964.1 addiction module toxin, RelE/StbE family [Dactylococcopsis salina PCC 8305]
MALYKIEWKQSAKKEIKKLDKTIISKILEAVAVLAENPHPRSSKKLKGTENTYRIRIGNYRVVYSVFPSVLTIEIVKVGHRKSIYR